LIRISQFIAAVAWPEDGGPFVQVADLPNYGTWGAANWNGRFYVGFYTHPHGRDLPLYRSGVNDETFEFVRMLGSGESLPELFVSSDGSALHATTEGHLGPRQSPGMHWWTTDSEHAQDWQSQSFSERHEYRWGIASYTDLNSMYMAFSGARVGAKLMTYGDRQKRWLQAGPVVSPDEHAIVLEIQRFRDNLYAAGGLASRWDKPDCGRIYRIDQSLTKWESVFPVSDGLISSSAVFADKLWVGTVFGTKVYSSADGQHWQIEHDFETTGSWPGVDAMIVHDDILFVACGNDDDQVQIVARSANGHFQTLLKSSSYKNISAFVTRGDDLYAFGAKTEGGGMVLKLLRSETAP
jgi:hypothetical protein